MISSLPPHDSLFARPSAWPISASAISWPLRPPARPEITPGGIVGAVIDVTERPRLAERQIAAHVAVSESLVEEELRLSRRSLPGIGSALGRFLADWCWELDTAPVTARELEVLGLPAARHLRDRIARDRGDPATVKTHSARPAANEAGSGHDGSRAERLRAHGQGTRF